MRRHSFPEKLFAVKIAVQLCSSSVWRPFRSAFCVEGRHCLKHTYQSEGQKAALDALSKFSGQINNSPRPLWPCDKLSGNMAINSSHSHF